MAEKLSAQTAAVGGDVTDDDLLYLVNDPSGTPASRKITVATLMQAAAVRELLLDYLGDTVWQSGGGITVTHSDGGNTLTLGATGVLEDLNTLGASTTDGEFLVATGAGTLAWESGATARTSLGVDAAGTDNSTDVTLVGSYDYLTIAGQAITLGQVDLTTDVTGLLPGANIASDLTASQVSDFSTAADARIALAVLDDLADVTETTITTGDLLRWNGSAWVNYADSNFGSASDVSSNTTHRTSDGSDHTFIDQDVTSGATPTFTATNISGASGITGLGTITSGTWQGTAIDSAYIDQTLSVSTLTATGNVIASGFRKSSGGLAVGSADSTLSLYANDANAVVYSAAGNADHQGNDISNVGTLTATTLNGTLGTAAQPNITSVGATTATSITVSGGSFAAASFYKDAALGSVLSAATGGTYDLYVSDPVGGRILSVLTGAKNVEVNGNFNAVGAVSGASLVGTLTTAAQPNVTSVGTLTGLTVSGALDLAANGDVLTFTDTGNECRIVWDATGANAALVGNESMYVLIDANNDQTTRGFLVGHNATTPGAATVLFKVLEDGITTVNEDLALTTGSITSASGAIDFGNENLTTSGNITVDNAGATAGITATGTNALVSLKRTAENKVARIRFYTNDVETWTIGLPDSDDLSGLGSDFYIGPSASSAYYVIDTSGNHDFQSGTITTTGAISGASFGGITSANLLDKSATETVSGAYTFTAQTTISHNLNFPNAGTRILFNSNRAFEGATDGSLLEVGEQFTTTQIHSALTGTSATFTGAISGGAGTFDQLTLANTGSFAANRIYRDTTYGMVITGGSGSTHDMLITNAAGNDVLYLGKAGDTKVYVRYDLMVGSSSVSPDGTLHVHTASAGAVTASTSADELVVENSTDSGVSILSPDADNSIVYWGSASLAAGAQALWNYNASQFTIGTLKVGASTRLRADNAVTNLTLSGASGSELATFAGDVTLSAGVLNIDGGAASETIRNHADTGVSPYNSWYYDGARVGYLQAQNGDFELASDNGDTLTLKASGRMDFYANGSEVARFDTSDNFLLGATSTSNNAQLYATKTYSAASGNDQGFKTNYVQSVATTGEFSSAVIGGSASHTSGTVGAVLGIVPTVVVSGAGGTTTSAYAGRFAVQNTNATATITNAYGVYVSAFTATGTITNRWGIYQAGASEKNHLNGATYIGTTSATSHGNEVLKLYGSANQMLVIERDASTGSYVQFINSTTGDTITDGFQVGLDGAEDANLINHEATVMKFWTANTERLRIASDAYAIGIGTTDVESWHSSWGAVQFGGSAIMGGNSGSTNNLYMIANAYYDGAWKHRTTDEIAVFEVADGGLFNWYTVASGTADTTATLLTKMTLANNGDLTLATGDLTVTAGQLNLAAATTARPSLNIPSGTAPTSPTNGDIWSDGSDILVRLGGTTYTLNKT